MPDKLPTRKLSVRFYRLGDLARQETVRSCAEAKEMLARAHHIHFDQDRVCLLPAGCENVRPSVGLPPKPKTSVLFRLFDELFRSPRLLGRQLHRCRADFHVFLVWDFEDDLNLEPGPEGVTASPNRVLGVTLASAQTCIIKDFDEPVAGEVLAHEVGHFLTPNLHGDKAHHADPKNLMYWENQGGTNLDDSQRRSMNGNAGLQPVFHPTCAPRSP